MIGPRRGVPAVPQTSRARSSILSARKENTERSRVSGSRSRSRCSSTRQEIEKETEKSKEKEFAWMDSDDEASASPASPPSQPREKSPEKVALEDVHTLSQMTRMAGSFEQRLKRREMNPRDLVELVRALSRSKYFDPSLFARLTDALRKAFGEKALRGPQVLDVLCRLSDLNAYNVGLFNDGCELLQPVLEQLPEVDRQRFEASLKQVKHSISEGLADSLKTKKLQGDTRAACPMFWRGQCKWGPKCKLSHDVNSFEGTAREGTWRPPSVSGGPSRGFKQSADMFTADKCGALW